MISKEERQYYIEPLARPIIPTSCEGLKVLVTRSRYERVETKPGSIVDVNETYMDSELWWVTDGERHVQGHVINNANIDRRSRTRIAPLSDDLFALVTVTDMRADQPFAQAELAAYSNPSLPLRQNTMYGMFPLTVPAAPWAMELMPTPGDTEEVVRKKVELAKLKHDQRTKAIELIREGMSRGWLHHLDTLREGHSAYMPQPLFDLHITGNVLIPTGRAATEDVLSAVRDRLAARGSRLPVPSADQATTYVTAPVTAVVERQATYSAAQEQDNAAFRTHVRSFYGDSTLDGRVTSSLPLLRSATN